MRCQYGSGVERQEEAVESGAVVGECIGGSRRVRGQRAESLRTVRGKVTPAAAHYNTTHAVLSSVPVRQSLVVSSDLTARIGCSASPLSAICPLLLCPSPCVRPTLPCAGNDVAIVAEWTMGNAPPDHRHAVRSASLDTSATTTPTRPRTDARLRHSTPGSAPTTASNTQAASEDGQDIKLDPHRHISPVAPPPLSSLGPASQPDEDIVYTLAPTYNQDTTSVRHPLLAALDALPLTEPLSTTLDPLSIDEQPVGSPYCIERVQRVDARAVDELLRLCRQYVKDDVAELFADQRDIARQMDTVEEEFGRLPATVRSMNHDVRRLLLELNSCQQPSSAWYHTYLQSTAILAPLLLMS